MSGPSYDYGVTVADITESATGLVFRNESPDGKTPATTPSLAGVQRLIASSSDLMTGWLHSMGVAPESVLAAPDTKALVASLIVRRVTNHALLARSRDNPELARELRRQYEAEKTEVEVNVRLLGTARNVTPTGPGVPSTNRYLRGQRAVETPTAAFLRRSGGQL